MDDKTALVTSNAGMRLIALQTLINRGDFDRLQTYFGDYCTAAALEAESAYDRVTTLRTHAEKAGKLKMAQVLAVDKHRVVALLFAQNVDGFFVHELAVEEDFPHKIMSYTHHPLEADAS